MRIADFGFLRWLVGLPPAGSLMAATAELSRKRAPRRSAPSAIRNPQPEIP